MVWPVAKAIMVAVVDIRVVEADVDIRAVEKTVELAEEAPLVVAGIVVEEVPLVLVDVVMAEEAPQELILAVAEIVVAEVL